MDEPPDGKSEPPEPRGGTLAKLLAIQARIQAATERLAAHDSRLDDVTDRVEHVAEQTGALADTIENLAEERRQVKPIPIWWPNLDDAQLAEHYPALCTWLRDTLAGRYPRDASVLTPCWADHPEARDALTSLWLTWKSAYLDETADTALAADWHTSRRPLLIGVVKNELNGCDDQACHGLEPLPAALLLSFEPVNDP